MNYESLIAKQALEIAKLEERLALYREAAKGIRSEIYCIGGPLNDNIGRYTHKQLVIFSRIMDHIDFEI